MNGSLCGEKCNVTVALYWDAQIVKLSHINIEQGSGKLIAAVPCMSVLPQQLYCIGLLKSCASKLCIFVHTGNYLMHIVCFT